MSGLVCLHDLIIPRTFHSALDSSYSGASKMTISTSSGSEEEVLDAEVSEAGVVSGVVDSVVVVSVVGIGLIAWSTESGYRNRYWFWDTCMMHSLRMAVCRRED